MMGRSHTDICKAYTRTQEEHYFSRILDDIGCKYTAEGKVLKISQGAMAMMKEKKVNTLYHLLGETMIGIAAVSLGELDYDLTQL